MSIKPIERNPTKSEAQVRNRIQHLFTVLFLQKYEVDDEEDDPVMEQLKKHYSVENDKMTLIAITVR